MLKNAETSTILGLDQVTVLKHRKMRIISIRMMFIFKALCQYTLEPIEIHQILSIFK